MTTLDDLIREMEQAGRAKRARWKLRRWRVAVVRSPRTAMTAWRCAVQRVRRGWDDRAVWSLDVHLTKQLGEQLTYMADIAHGWPSSETFPTFESWVAALRLNAAALTEYARASDDIPLVSDTVKSDARAALHWVADNFGKLWD